MPTTKTTSILHAFQALKKRKDKMDKQQYVNELYILKNELDRNIKNPKLEKEEMLNIYKLINSNSIS